MKTTAFPSHSYVFADIAKLTLKIPQEIGNHEYNQLLDIKTAQGYIDHFELPSGPI